MVGGAVEQMTKWEIRELLDALPPEEVRNAFLGGDHVLRLDSWAFERLQDAERSDDGRRALDLIRPAMVRAA